MNQAKTIQGKQAAIYALIIFGLGGLLTYLIYPYMGQRAQRAQGVLLSDFDLPLIGEASEGDRIRLSDMKGKVVVIDLWASWCAPCREQSKVLSELTQEVGANVQIIGIATSDAIGPATAFLKEEKATYPSAFDEKGSIARALKVEGLPTTIIIDADGKTRFIERRPLTKIEILSLIQAAK